MMARFEDEFHKPITGVFDVPMVRNTDKHGMSEYVMPQLAQLFNRWFVYVPLTLPPTYREARGVHVLTVEDK